MKRNYRIAKLVLLVLLAIGIPSLFSISQMKPVSAAGGYVAFTYPGSEGELMDGTTRPFLQSVRFRAYPLPGYELKEMNWRIEGGPAYDYIYRVGTIYTELGQVTGLPIYSGYTYVLTVTGVFFQFPDYSTTYTSEHEWNFYGVTILS